MLNKKEKCIICLPKQQKEGLQRGGEGGQMLIYRIRRSHENMLLVPSSCHYDQYWFGE